MCEKLGPKEDPISHHVFGLPPSIVAENPAKMEASMEDLSHEFYQLPCLNPRENPQF